MKFLRSYLIPTCIATALIAGCSKNGPAPTDPPTPTPPTPPPVAKTCVLAGISQLNSGGKPDFALSITFTNDVASSFVLFDSLGNKKLFEASLQQITQDSIRIDQYQYLKIDANKRVTILVTKSDMSDPVNADDYKYVYTYNNEGYLSRKDFYINGALYYVSDYTYTNSLLTKCVVTIAGNSNAKLMESTLTYDNAATVKNWIYTFPDAFESHLYSPALNFGNKGTKALAQVITKIYNPISAATIDTWTTNYSNYVINTEGYVESAIANGDMQQGMASFYGKTAFYYQCK